MALLPVIVEAGARPAFSVTDGCHEPDGDDGSLYPKRCRIRPLVNIALKKNRPPTWNKEGAEAFDVGGPLSSQLGQESL
jgi:hypothetical protein